MLLPSLHSFLSLLVFVHSLQRKPWTYIHINHHIKHPFLCKQFFSYCKTIHYYCTMHSLHYNSILFQILSKSKLDHIGIMYWTWQSRIAKHILCTLETRHSLFFGCPKIHGYPAISPSIFPIIFCPFRTEKELNFTGHWLNWKGILDKWHLFPNTIGLLEMQKSFEVQRCSCWEEFQKLLQEIFLKGKK